MAQPPKARIQVPQNKLTNISTTLSNRLTEKGSILLMAAEMKRQRLNEIECKKRAELLSKRNHDQAPNEGVKKQKLAWSLCHNDNKSKTQEIGQNKIPSYLDQFSKKNQVRIYKLNKIWKYK